MSARLFRRREGAKVLGAGQAATFRKAHSLIQIFCWFDCALAFAFSFHSLKIHTMLSIPALDCPSVVGHMRGEL